MKYRVSIRKGLMKIRAEISDIGDIKNKEN